jgi:hypothetical protein
MSLAGLRALRIIAKISWNDCLCAGFSDACITKHPRAPTTGVREAPRHEIAGRKGALFRGAIYGNLRSASVCFREVGTTDALQFDGLTGGISGKFNGVHAKLFDRFSASSPRVLTVSETGR